MIGRPSHILIFKFEDTIKINDGGHKMANKYKITFDDTPTTQYELEEWLREKAHEINYYCVH